jgi:hypothetical protein
MRFLTAAVAGLLGFGLAQAADIVTMPTANQLKQGEVDGAIYYLDLDMPAAAPQSVNYQTLYVGVTDWLELDIHRADVKDDEESYVLVGSIKLLSESATRPDLVVGMRNIGKAETTNSPVKELSDDPSYFISAAKTFMLGSQPGPPLVRAHLSYGTEDWTLLGEERHDGLFGGLQALITPSIGAIVLHDGNDLITGVTFMPKGMGLTFKAGTYGKHTWVGLSFQHDMY